MSKQLELFTNNRPKPKQHPIPHNKSETSQAAAESIRPVANALGNQIYEFIKSRGPHGATDQEVQTELDISGDTQRPRRDRLHKAGLIRRSGEKRETPSGRWADVWVAVQDTAP